MKYLTYTGFVNPLTVNRLPITAVVENGIIQTHGMTFNFRDGEPYPDGTEVIVKLGRFFYCSSLAEIEERRRRTESKKLEWQQKLAEMRRKREADAAIFNEGLNIPVAWRPDIKAVLSGLSANSWGDGRNRRTVVHVYLLEKLHEGRLHRNAKEFLCTPDSGKIGLQHWHDDKDPVEKVTCRKCIRMTNRWSKK